MLSHIAKSVVVIIPHIADGIHVASYLSEVLHAIQTDRPRRPGVMKLNVISDLRIAGGRGSREGN